MTLAFTVCNRHQLGQALCMGESLIKHNPTFKFILGWVDRANLPMLPNWVEVIRVETLQIGDWEGMHTRYFEFELVDACRPFFATRILETHSACRVLLFLAPTTFIFQPLDSILSATSFFQLTPHRLQPQHTDKKPDDKAILNNGMFTSGSWIMHPDGQEKQLLDWWGKRTQTRAYYDLCEGMCMDQLWLNYIPTYFDRVQIIRNNSWHFMYITDSTDEITLTDHIPYIKGKKLISVDFAGLDSYHPVWSNFTDKKSRNQGWDKLRKIYLKHLTVQNSLIEFEKVPYGKPKALKSNRIQRKRGVSFLRKLIKKIETYDLTYN